jgi:hypothetical protein
MDRQPLSKRVRGRVLGLGVTGAASFAFAMAPFVTAPAANADEFEVILDPIINSLSAVDPTLGADVGALVTSFDPTFATDSATATQESRRKNQTKPPRTAGPSQRVLSRIAVIAVP